MEPDFADYVEFCRRENILWIPDNARGKDYANVKKELRSKTSSTCGICGTKTNQWGVYFFMGYPSLHLVCPYRNDGGNTEENVKHTKLQEYQDRLYQDKGLTSREIQEIEAEIQKLQDYFEKLSEDVIVP